MQSFSSLIVRRLLPACTGAALLGLGSCAPNQDEPAPSVGSLNVRRYVAVGDTYTAGVSEGGLTRTSQEYSYANLLAQQFQKVDPEATFSQPLMEAGSGSGYLELVGIDASGLVQTRRVPGQAVRGAAIPFMQQCTPIGRPINDTLRLLNRSASASVGLPQNLGIPGLRLSQVNLADYGNEVTSRSQPASFNPYFERLLPANSNLTYRRAVSKASANATFFTYFLGLDDFLPFIRSGGQCDELLPDEVALRTNATSIIDTLAAGSRKGVVALLPELPSLPILGLGKAETVLKQMQIARGDSSIRLYLVVPVPPGSTPPPPRNTLEGTDFILPQGMARLGKLVDGNGAPAQKPYGLDPSNPLRDEDVLDYTEFDKIKTIRTSYNATLTTLATNYKLALLDVDNELFNVVAGQLAVNGVVYSQAPVRGNFFSLDNYTLTPRGNALLANTFIRIINNYYKANLPALNVNNYPTTARP